MPIGNLTGQHFANFYLANSDHFLLEKIQVPAYVRYMDDMVLWANDKKLLLDKVTGFTNYLENILQLAVKPARLNHASRGLPFLGYVVFPDKIRLTKHRKQRFFRKDNKYHQLLRAGIWTQEEFSRHTTPLYAFLEHAQSKQLRLIQIQKQEIGRRAPTT